MASASSDSVSVDEINELLTCCMCLETLHEPRSLPCFHNFCKVCLGEYILLFKKSTLHMLAWVPQNRNISYPVMVNLIQGWKD
jgi:hypothetical protein